MPRATRAVLEMGARGFMAPCGLGTSRKLGRLPLPAEVGYIRLQPLVKCRTRVNPSSDGRGVKVYRGSGNPLTPTLSPNGEREPTGFAVRWSARSPKYRTASLHVTRIRELREVGNLLDHADLQQQVGRLLVEGRELAGEERLVGGAVLPAQVLC